MKGTINLFYWNFQKISTNIQIDIGKVMTNLKKILKEESNHQVHIPILRSSVFCLIMISTAQQVYLSTRGIIQVH